MDKQVLITRERLHYFSHLFRQIWQKNNSVKKERKSALTGCMRYLYKWIIRRNCQFSSVQSHSHVQLFVNPWTAARQASLSITNSWRPPKPMCIELVMPSNHLILCRPLLLFPSIFPSIRFFFQMIQLFASDGRSIGVSASTSVLPINTQD